MYLQSGYLFLHKTQCFMEKQYQLIFSVSQS